MSEKATKIAYLVLSLLLAILFWLYVDASKGHMMSQDFNSAEGQDRRLLHHTGVHRHVRLRHFALNDNINGNFVGIQGCHLEGNVAAGVNVTVPVYMMKELPLTVKFKQSPGSTLANASWNLEPDKITIMGDPLSLETIEEISLGDRHRAIRGNLLKVNDNPDVLLHHLLQIISGATEHHVRPLRKSAWVRWI